MDGDCAPLREISALCVRHDALLVLDEAHDALNVPLELPDELQWLRVGTLSKMLGAAGGWVAGAQPLIDLLINRARSFIYTTALSPADTAAALEALRIIRSPEGQTLRSVLRHHIDRVRPDHQSAIVPIIFGKESAALAAAAALYEQGIYIPAIRPPTVPAGTSRLRIALSAAHTDAMIAQLIEALGKLAHKRAL
jgi:8-amino-7-oxononanoate synthase